MKIIYLSGIDGCGKTTQAKLLVSNLKQKGIHAEYMWFRWEPTFKRVINILKRKYIKSKITQNDKKKSAQLENENQTKWLNCKRSILNNAITRKLWLNYATADYYLAYRHRFKKADADIIVLDRYVYDFIIDQAVNLNYSHDQCKHIKDLFFIKKFKLPDFHIIINISAKEGYLRKQDGTSSSYLEARENYYKSISGTRCIHLNGHENIETLNSNIAAWVYKHLLLEDK